VTIYRDYSDFGSNSLSGVSAVSGGDTGNKER